MDVGDRVVYVLNDEIDLDRDAGTVVAFEEVLHHPVVEFDDGYKTAVNPDELKKLVEKRPKQTAMHLHFGCSEDPCLWPGHS